MHTQCQWKWHPKFVVGDRNGSVYSEQRQGHAYAIAMQPRYVTDEQWRDDASLIVRAVNAHDALVAALESCRRVAGIAERLCGNTSDEAYICDIQQQIDAALLLAKYGSSQVERAQ